MIIPIVVTGQEFKTEGKTMTVVFKVDSVSKQDIHSRVLSAIANLYNNANNVIQLNDTQNNKVIVKGLSSFMIPNDMKPITSKTIYVPSFLDLKYNHTINIDSKDGRYRMVYQITSTPTFKNQYADNPFYYKAKFDKLSEEEIQERVKMRLAPLEQAKLFYGKKKREAYREEIPRVYDIFYNKVVSEAKATLLSINELVQKNNKINPLTNDDW